jgi:hypothetical protein
VQVAFNGGYGMLALQGGGEALLHQHPMYNAFTGPMMQHAMALPVGTFPRYHLPTAMQGYSAGVAVPNGRVFAPVQHQHLHPVSTGDGPALCSSLATLKHQLYTEFDIILSTSLL